MTQPTDAQIYHGSAARAWPTPSVALRPWFAQYLWRGEWVTARDARGEPIECDSPGLARSVARYRIDRVKRGVISHGRP